MLIAPDTMADLTGRIDALLRQEVSYQADDYLSTSHRNGEHHDVEDADRAAPPSTQAFSLAHYRKRSSHEISPPCSPSPLPISEPSVDRNCHEIPPSPSQALPIRSSSPSSVEDSPDLPSRLQRFDRKSNTSATSEATLCQDWRAQMTEWQFSVTDSLSMSREIATISASYLDRYLSSKGPNVSRRHFQLVSMTCLYLSTKIYDHKILPPGSIVNLSRGHFTADDIESTEREVLNELGWKVSPPTPLTFAKHFILLLPPNSVTKSVHRFILDTTKYLTELSVIDYSFVTHRASSIGLAAILTAMEQTYEFELDLNTRKSFEQAIYAAAGIDCTGPEVAECRDQLRSIYSRGAFRMTRSGDGRRSTTKKKKSKRRRQVEIFQSPRSVVLDGQKA